MHESDMPDLHTAYNDMLFELMYERLNSLKVNFSKNQLELMPSTRQMLSYF